MVRNSKYLVFIALSCASFLATYTGAAINVSLPIIGKEFGMNHSQLQYIISAYLMMNAVFLVPFGKLSDIYGRRIFFLSGMIIFTLAHLISAFATSGIFLIICRGIAGIGGAMFFCNIMAILSDVYEKNERGRMLGGTVSVAYVGITVGPYIGGLITKYFGWHFVFFSVVPVAIVTIFMTWMYLPGKGPDLEKKKSQKFNFGSSFLYVISLLLLISGLSRMPGTEGRILIISGILLGGLFIWCDYRIGVPLFNLKELLKNKGFVFANLANFTQYFSTYAISFMLSLLLQNKAIKGLSPDVAGLVLLIQPLTQVIFAPLAGSISDRFSPRFLASFGMCLIACSIFILFILPLRAPLYLLFIALFTLGLGFSFFTTPNNNLIMSNVSRKIYGIASGIIATGRILGMSFSLATTALVLNIYSSQDNTPLLFMKSFHVVFGVLLLFSISGILASFISERNK